MSPAGEIVSRKYLMDKIAIHIFNPEADYSLAEFKESYTPPAKVIELRRRLALTPLRFAKPHDFILLLDNPLSSPEDKRVITPDRSKDFFRAVCSSPGKYEIRPWNHTPDLRHRLRLAGAPEILLPDDATLGKIRSLSSRATTVTFNSALNSALSGAGLERHLSPLPIIFHHPEKALDWLERERRCFFKYPWSSSGRGILLADITGNPSLIRHWIEGGIRRQGFIMGETLFPKTLDFATEWRICDGHAEYLGVSIFQASGSGKYIANISDCQNSLLRIIKDVAPDFGEKFIEAQRISLEKIAEGYEGFAGIDMMASQDGRISGGVEINFRMTMGIVALLEQQRLKNADIYATE